MTTMDNSALWALCSNFFFSTFLNLNFSPAGPEWDPWSSWSPCSVTCGWGTQLSSRVCTSTSLVCWNEPELVDEKVQKCHFKKCPSQFKWWHSVQSTTMYIWLLYLLQTGVVLVPVQGPVALAWRSMSAQMITAKRIVSQPLGSNRLLKSVNWKSAPEMVRACSYTITRISWVL